MFRVKKSLGAVVVVSVLALSAALGSSSVRAQVQSESFNGVAGAAGALGASSKGSSNQSEGSLQKTPSGKVAGDPENQTDRDARMIRTENLKASLKRGLASYGYGIEFKAKEAIITVIQKGEDSSKDPIHQVNQAQNVECFVGLTIGAQTPYSDMEGLMALAEQAYRSKDLFDLLKISKGLQNLSGDELDFQKMKHCVALESTDPVVAEALKDYNKTHYLKLTSENVALEIPKVSNSAIRDSMRAISEHQILARVNQILNQEATKRQNQQDQVQAQRSAPFYTKISKEGVPMSTNVNELVSNFNGIISQKETPQTVRVRVATAANVIHELQELLSISIKGERLNTGKFVEPQKTPAGFDELASATQRIVDGVTSKSAITDVSKLKDYLWVLIDQNGPGPQKERLATTLNLIDDCEIAWNASMKGARLNVGLYISPQDVGSSFDETAAALAKKPSPSSASSGSTKLKM